MNARRLCPRIAFAVILGWCGCRKVAEKCNILLITTKKSRASQATHLGWTGPSMGISHAQMMVPIAVDVAFEKGYSMFYWILCTRLMVNFLRRNWPTGSVKNFVFRTDARDALESVHALCRFGHGFVAVGKCLVFKMTFLRFSFWVYSLNLGRIVMFW